MKKMIIMMVMVMTCFSVGSVQAQRHYAPAPRYHHHYGYHHHYSPWWWDVPCHGHLGSFIVGAVVGAVVESAVDAAVEAEVDRAAERAERRAERRAEAQERGEAPARYGRRQGYYQRGRYYGPRCNGQLRGECRGYELQQRSDGSGFELQRNNDPYYNNPLPPVTQDTLREGQTPPRGMYHQPNPGNNTAGNRAESDSIGFKINW